VKVKVKEFEKMETNLKQVKGRSQASLLCSSFLELSLLSVTTAMFRTRCESESKRVWEERR